MANKKQIKLRVKKRKLRIKRIIICLLVLIVTILLCYFSIKAPIKNIYVVGNKIVSDKEIIEMASIENYPSFLKTLNRDIQKKIEKNEYIKSVRVEKKFYNKIYIYITEKKIICEKDGNLLAEDGTLLPNTYNLTMYPLLISDIKDVEDKFASKFSEIEDDILLKISEIEYTPNNVDNERFALKMNDGNLVYVTLNKITKINKYNSIYAKLEGKRGIIYLDAGDYIEIKEE